MSDVGPDAGGGEQITLEWLHGELKKLAVANLPPIDLKARLTELAALAKPFNITFSDLKKTLQGYMAAKQAAAEAAMQATLAPHIEAMNGQYFLWRNGSKIKIGELVPRRLNGHIFTDIVGYSAPDFRVACANQIYMGDAVSELWLTSPDRREVVGTTVDPKAPPLTVVNNRLNLWQGFGVEPKPGDHSWFTKHLILMFGGNQKVAIYVLNWLALAFQKPDQPIQTGIILIGPQGAGKGMLGNTVRSIFGPHGVTIYTRNGLIGKHNGHLRAACFVFCDEPPFARDMEAAEILKHMITEPTIQIEPKFIDAEEIDNRLKLFAATNHRHAVHADRDDRRLAVFEVSDALVGKADYFKAYKAKSDDPACKAAVLDFLLKLDVSNFEPGRDRPITDVYVAQKVASLTGDWLFWRAVCERETFAVAKGMLTYGNQLHDLPQELSHVRMIQKTAIYNAYCEWHSIEHPGKGSPVHRDWFWRNFYQWSECETKRAQYDPNAQSGARSQIAIPHLRVLRRRLEAHLGKLDGGTDMVQQ
jgi:hypothetical protein